MQILIGIYPCIFLFLIASLIYDWILPEFLIVYINVCSIMVVTDVLTKMFSVVIP